MVKAAVRKRDSQVSALPPSFDETVEGDGKKVAVILEGGVEDDYEEKDIEVP